MLPMSLLDACEGSQIDGRTRLQKLVFLLEQNLNDTSAASLDSSDYNFIPYDYGPFSKELYDDLDSLEEHGLIEVEEEPMADGKVKYVYRLTGQGRSWVRGQLADSSADTTHSLAESLASEYEDMLLSELIDEVYAEYPEYAENSVW
jgi:uncharacterized protein YwgA